MRTTLTLDEDVVAKLKAEARRSGKAFREVVNETLRAGLMITRRSVPRAAFKVVRAISDPSSPACASTASRICSIRPKDRCINNSRGRNLLLYAYHPRAEQHAASKSWLEAVLRGPGMVRFAWLTLWAFLRIYR
jgi:hypothetical protein